MARRPAAGIDERKFVGLCSAVMRAQNVASASRGSRSVKADARCNTLYKALIRRRDRWL